MIKINMGILAHIFRQPLLEGIYSVSLISTQRKRHKSCVKIKKRIKKREKVQTLLHTPGYSICVMVER